MINFGLEDYDFQNLIRIGCRIWKNWGEALLKTFCRLSLCFFNGTVVFVSIIFEQGKLKIDVMHIQFFQNWKRLVIIVNVLLCNNCKFVIIIVLSFICINVVCCVFYCEQFISYWVKCKYVLIVLFHFMFLIVYEILSSVCWKFFLFLLSLHVGIDVCLTLYSLY